MMSLVDYGSCSSDEEIEDNAGSEAEIKTTAVASSSRTAVAGPSVSFKSESAFSLKFDDLPEPQPEAPVPSEVIDEEGPIPPKKVYDDMEVEEPPGKDFKSIGSITARKIGGRMKIAAPSLKGFEEDEQPGKLKHKVIHPETKRSGLFSILPEPKMPVIEKPKIDLEEPGTSTRAPQSFTADEDEGMEEEPPARAPPKANPFVPHVVQQTLLGKRPPPTKLEEIRAKYLKQEANVQIVSRKNKKKTESDESDEEASDFFSFASAKESIPDDPSLRLPDYVPPSESNAGEPLVTIADGDVGQVPYDGPSSSSSNEDVLKYIHEGKKVRKEAINFIDVSADALRPDSTEWIKNITAEPAGYTSRPSRDAPGGLTKRKHQITYLAFQAKEREQELKNQWAQNRHNKRMTQSKYGF